MAERQNVILKKKKKKMVNFMPYEQNPTDVINVPAVNTKTSPYN